MSAEMLERNRAFAAAGGHEGAVVLPNLNLFVITCLDPRVDPAHVLGLRLSDALVVRNVGGRVTPEVTGDVAFICQIAENLLPDGPLFEVAVIHHTQCGAGALADDSFRRAYAERIGTDEAALRERPTHRPAVGCGAQLAARGWCGNNADAQSSERFAWRHDAGSCNWVRRVQSRRRASRGGAALPRRT